MSLRNLNYSQSDIFEYTILSGLMKLYFKYIKWKCANVAFHIGNVLDVLVYAVKLHCFTKSWLELVSV